jgi:hypothetical protein
MIGNNLSERSRARLVQWALSAAIVCLSLCALAVIGVSSAVAGYTMNWFATDASGSPASTTSGYTLRATIGEPEAGLLSGGTYSMFAGFMAAAGNVSTLGVGDDPPSGLPVSFQLRAAVPNPVVDRTVISFDLPEPRTVSLLLYDVAGRLTRTLAVGALPAGHHQRSWDRTDEGDHRVAPGIYFVVLNAQSVQLKQKVVVVR